MAIMKRDPEEKAGVGALKAATKNRTSLLSARMFEPAPLAVEAIATSPCGAMTAVGRSKGVIEILDEYQALRNTLYLPNVQSSARCLAWMAKIEIAKNVSNDSCTRSAAAREATGSSEDHDDSSSSSSSSDDDDSDAEDEDPMKAAKHTRKAKLASKNAGKEMENAHQGRGASSGGSSTFDGARVDSARSDYFLVVGGLHGSFHCFDVDSGKLQLTSSSFGGAIWSLSYRANRLFLSTDDGSLKVFQRDEQVGDFALAQTLSSGAKNTRAVSHCVFPNGDIYVGDTNGRITKWTKTATGKFANSGVMQVTLAEGDRNTNGSAVIWRLLCVSSDTLAAGDSLGQVSIYDTKQCVLRQRFQKHDGEIQCLQIAKELQAAGAATSTTTLYSAGVDAKIQAYVLNQEQDNFVVGNSYFADAVGCHDIAGMDWTGVTWCGGRGSPTSSSSTSGRGGRGRPTSSSTSPTCLQLLYGGLDGGLFLTKVKEVTGAGSNLSASSSTAAGTTYHDEHNSTTQRWQGPYGSRWWKDRVSVSQYDPELGSTLVCCTDVTKADIWHMDLADGVLLGRSHATHTTEKPCSSSSSSKPMLKRAREQPGKELAPTKFFQIALKDPTLHLVASAVSTKYAAFSNARGTRVFGLDLAEIEVFGTVFSDKQPSLKLCFVSDSFLAMAKERGGVVLVNLAAAKRSGTKGRAKKGEAESMIVGELSPAGSAGGSGSVTLLKASESREWLAVADLTQRITIYNLDTMKAQAVLPRRAGSVVDIIFDRNRITAVYSSREYQVYDLDQAHVVARGSFDQRSISGMVSIQAPAERESSVLLWQSSGALSVQRINEALHSEQDGEAAASSKKLKRRKIATQFKHLVGLEAIGGSCSRASAQSRGGDDGAQAQQELPSTSLLAIEIPDGAATRMLPAKKPRKQYGRK